MCVFYVKIFPAVLFSLMAYFHSPCSNVKFPFCYLVFLPLCEYNGSVTVSDMGDAHLRTPITGPGYAYLYWWASLGSAG